MASYGGGGRDKRDGEPTLSEIGTELVSKVKQLPGAIYTGLTNLANKILPGRPKVQEPLRQQKSMLEGMFGGGIMGKMMENTLGRAVENLAKNAAEQLRATQQRTEQVQQKAAQAIESSKQLREYLGGGMQVAEPVSESSSMESVDGQVSQTVQLIMPVLGSNGRVAHAQVQSSGEGHMDIQVQLPGGRLLRIDPHESAYDNDQDKDDFSQKGRVIDVDWREVR